MFMEIENREISKLSGYSLSKVRKDAQRGKLATLDALIRYVLVGIVENGLVGVGRIVKAVSGDLAKSSGSVSDVEEAGVDFGEFELDAIARMMGRPFNLARCAAEQAVLDAREFLGVSEVIAVHAEELGW